MKYFSTNDVNRRTGFRQAVIKGLPNDNGLFFPERIPRPSILTSLEGADLHEIAFEILREYTKEDISSSRLTDITTEVLSFSIPLVQVEQNIHALELFHGPTMAFKDVGARYLARMIRDLSDDRLTVLVATSGDTGSAVANGFFGVDGIDVIILYPSGKISDIQEKQLTTLGGNVRALEVDGVFDDCQRLVKEAFLDQDLNKEIALTSANSINIMRWIPQSIYYAWGLSQLRTSDEVVAVVPSGNFGNLAAGVLAAKMGLPISSFVAATNANHVVPDYLKSGEYKPQPSTATISNAMDVGDPSNFPRLLALYGNDYKAMKNNIEGYWQEDDATRSTIERCMRNNNYLLDPHGAIAFEAATRIRQSEKQYMFMHTAHPAKFKGVIDDVLGSDLEIPERLAESLAKEKKSTPIAVDYLAFKEIILG